MNFLPLKKGYWKVTGRKKFTFFHHFCHFLNLNCHTVLSHSNEFYFPFFSVKIDFILSMMIILCLDPFFFSFVRLFIITASGMHNDDDPYITILYGFLCWKNFSLMVMIIIHTHTRKEMLTMIIIIMSCEWWWILSHHDHQQNHYGQQ